MTLTKFFLRAAVVALVLPGLSSCASAVHMPGTDKSAVFESATEEPHYASEILQIAETKTSKDETAGKHEHSSELPYVCPMHPEVQSDKPGKCPKCGMKLQLREKEKGHEHH
jgi:Heavy metal binding domain